MEIRNYSPRSIKTYVSMLAGIAGYYHQSPEKLSVEQIKKYLQYCKQDLGRSVSTINQTISALKILFKDVLGIPWGDIRIKRPKKNRYMPDILSREEVSDMIRLTNNFKHKAILTVLYSSGMRREELLNLKITDIDSNRMLIRIRNGKGNKSRDTLLSKNALLFLRKYYVEYRPEMYLFESWEKGAPYSGSSVINIVRKAAKLAAITKHIYPHSLRHAFATHLLEQGTNLKIIQKLLGHGSLRSTSVYLHLAKTDFKNVKNPFDELQNPV